MIIRSEKMSELAAALVKAQKAMGKVHKSAENPFFKSKYADLEAVLDTVLDPLNENDIALVQLTGNDGDRATVNTVLMHKSGEFIGCEAGMLLAKNDGHTLGSAVTYLRRYGAAAAVGLAQTDDDGNAVKDAHDAEPEEPLSSHEVTVMTGSFRGMTLGEVAVQGGYHGAGMIRYWATRKDEFAKHAAVMAERHPVKYSDEDITDYLQDAATEEQLNSLWRCLTPEQQSEEMKERFATTKTDLQNSHKRTADNARG